MRTVLIWCVGAAAALAAEPEVLWTYDAGGRAREFEQQGNYLLVNRGDNTLSCLSRETGREMWTRPLSWADKREVVDGKFLQVAKGNPVTPSRIEVIDLETGELKGEYDARRIAVLRTPHGYYGIEGREVFRLDPTMLVRRPFADLSKSFGGKSRRGNAAMETTGEDPVTLSAADDGLYAHACLDRSSGWKLVLVRLRLDGKVQWTRTLDGKVGSGLTLSGAQVYYVTDVDDRVLLEEIVNDTHWLTVLRKTDGRVLARHSQADSLSWVLIEGHGGALTHASRLFRAGRSVLHRKGRALCVVDLETGKQREFAGVLVEGEGADGWVADGDRVVLRTGVGRGSERLIAVSLKDGKTAWSLPVGRSKSLARAGQWLVIEERGEGVAFSRVHLGSGEKVAVEGVGRLLGFGGGVANFTSDYEKTQKMGWVRVNLADGTHEEEGIPGTYTRVLGPRWFVVSNRGIGGGDLNVLDLATGNWVWSIRKPGAADAEQLEESGGVFYLMSRGGGLLAVRP